jgi:hypothetical protein
MGYRGAYDRIIARVRCSIWHASQGSRYGRAWDDIALFFGLQLGDTPATARHVVATIGSVHGVDGTGDGRQTLVQASSRRESVDEANNATEHPNRFEFPEVPMPSACRPVTSAMLLLLDAKLASSG